MLFQLEKVKTWDKETYQEFIKYLCSLQDIKYKEFHSSLVLNSKYLMIGIRVPVMREIAKIISKGNIEEFLLVSQNKYYEEVMIQGLVIAKIKQEPVFYKYFQSYIKKIDNWALCDSFCNSIKIVRKYEKKYFDIALKLALNKKEFISRIGLVMILNHFVNTHNVMVILNSLNQISSNQFYVNMAEAWLLCDLYIKFPVETKVFLQKNNLNKFTQNKAISKIHDSYRVSEKDKELLSEYKK